MYTIVGYCPKCGAPIYSPTVWFAITPPPTMYPCGCFSQNKNTVTSTTTNMPIKEEQGE